MLWKITSLRGKVQLMTNLFIGDFLLKLNPFKMKDQNHAKNLFSDHILHNIKSFKISGAFIACIFISFKTNLCWYLEKKFLNLRSFSFGGATMIWQWEWTNVKSCSYQSFPLLNATCRDSLFVERQACDQEDASSNPRRIGGGIFFSRVNFLCWLLFGVSSNPVKVQVAGYT